MTSNRARFDGGKTSYVTRQLCCRKWQITCCRTLFEQAIRSSDAMCLVIEFAPAKKNICRCICLAVAGLVKWYNRPFVMVSWGFDSLIRHQFPVPRFKIHSSSLKTPAIPIFYKIIADNQGTKLVYNLVYSRTGVTETISYFRMTLLRGVGRRAQAEVRGSRTLVDGRSTRSGTNNPDLDL